FNRVWAPAVLDGPRRSVELARARELRPIVTKADFLLDIHSMQHISKPLLLSGPLDKGKRFAVEVGYPAHVVADSCHAAGRRRRDHGAFGDPNAPQNALLVECGQHWEAASGDVAREVLLRFLDTVGLLDDAARAKYLPGPKPPRPRVIEVTEAVT